MPFTFFFHGVTDGVDPVSLSGWPGGRQKSGQRFKIITSIAGVQRHGQPPGPWRWVGHFFIPLVFYFALNFDRLFVLYPRLNSDEI